jgi:hypothetical protein
MAFNTVPSAAWYIFKTTLIGFAAPEQWPKLHGLIRLLPANPQLFGHLERTDCTSGVAFLQRSYLAKM